MRGAARRRGCRRARWRRTRPPRHHQARRAADGGPRPRRRRGLGDDEARRGPREHRGQLGLGAAGVQRYDHQPARAAPRSRPRRTPVRCRSDQRDPVAGDKALPHAARPRTRRRRRRARAAQVRSRPPGGVVDGSAPRRRRGLRPRRTGSTCDSRSWHRSVPPRPDRVTGALATDRRLQPRLATSSARPPARVDRPRPRLDPREHPVSPGEPLRRPPRSATAPLPPTSTAAAFFDVDNTVMRGASDLPPRPRAGQAGTSSRCARWPTSPGSRRSS